MILHKLQVYYPLEPSNWFNHMVGLIQQQNYCEANGIVYILLFSVRHEVVMSVTESVANGN